ncbi:unnamed protein product [Adineta steineri]|uniref:EF-hand domain-containing protein n=1 Tax=Adineta steineri TaxID=433720 RepID=A0A819LKZ9_9BILA|nr:unnamed protein product [Adineta steineri]CAF3929883.1 unnamed protein product [Adineta steineri]CAF3967029.1 unnamed protein product [Adineta steineri]
MGQGESVFQGNDLEDYKALTFLTGPEITQVLKRFRELVAINKPHQSYTKWRLSKKQAVNINELYQNPFRERIVEVFSSQNDGSISFEDFLDMMSVFSEKAPKSVKVSYAFKIYQGIYKGDRPDGATATLNAIDLYDIREIVHRLSGENFADEELTKIAEAVIHEVDLRDDKTITSEIFEYFLSNVPDFPSSFVIPLSDGKEDRHVTSTVSVQPDATVPSVKHRRHRQNV